MTDVKSGVYCVLFDDGQKFPVKYYKTTDMYTVELPCGVYEGEYMRDLKRELVAEFNNVRIVSK